MCNIDKLLEIVAEDIDILINHLDLELHFNGRAYSSSCCIHGGDNKNALYIYKYENKYYYKCFTKHCEFEHGKSMIGLVRGIKKCTFGEAVRYLKQIYRIDDHDLVEKPGDAEKKGLFARVKRLSLVGTKSLLREKNYARN